FAAHAARARGPAGKTRPASLLAARSADALRARPTARRRAPARGLPGAFFSAVPTRVRAGGWCQRGLDLRGDVPDIVVPRDSGRRAQRVERVDTVRRQRWAVLRDEIRCAGLHTSSPAARRRARVSDESTLGR